MKSQVLLYGYDIENIDKMPHDYVKTGIDDSYLGKYQLVHRSVLSGHSITAMACVNSIQSPLMFAATSNK